VGAFSLKISIAPSGETIPRIKKVRGGVQKWYGRPLSPCQVWWGSWVARAGCRRKSVIFLSVCLSRFGITKIVITETLWSSAIFKTIMVPLHRGRFLVVHLYSSFSMDPWIFIRGKFIPEIANFGDFGSREATFLKPRRWKLAWLWARGRPSSTPNFVNIS